MMVAHMVDLEDPCEPSLHGPLVAGKMNQIIGDISRHKAQKAPCARRPGETHQSCPDQSTDRETHDGRHEIAKRIIRIGMVVAMNDEDDPLEHFRIRIEMEDETVQRVLGDRPANDAAQDKQRSPGRRGIELCADQNRRKRPSPDCNEYRCRNDRERFEKGIAEKPDAFPGKD